MLKFLQTEKNPKFVAITPLRPKDCITLELYDTIARNNVSFDWVTYNGKGNACFNTQQGLIEYCKVKKKPKYFIKLDNDLMFRYTPALDRMYEAILDTPKHIAYTFSSFAFLGTINMRFGADAFDVERLIESNYISSCSMIKTEAFEKIGGFITDKKFVRLLDWATWLKFLRHGYIGKACPEGFFEAISDEGCVSTGRAEDYYTKLALVKKHFVEPYKELLIKNGKM